MKLPNIREFTTPTGLGEKVRKVEESKEGVKEVEIIQAKETSIPISRDVSTAKTSLEEETSPILAYAIEYKVDSTRGLNHYNVKATIYNNNLFVFTAQSKEDSYPALRSNIVDIIESLVISK